MHEDSSMGMIAKAFTITGFGLIVASIISLVKNRVIATLQGAEGLGLVSQFTSFQSLVVGITTLGLSTGLVKYVSQYLESRDYERISNSVSSAFNLVLFASTAAAILLIFSSKWVSSLLVGDDSAWLYVIVIAVTIPVAALTRVFNSIINGAREIKSLARISVYSALASLIIAVPVIYFLGLVGVIIQISTTATVVFGINYVVGRRVSRSWPKKSHGLRVNKDESKLLLHFGVITSSTGLLFPLALLMTQTAIIHQEGLSENGLFAASWSLFWLYLGFATTSVVVYLLPTMSAAKDNSNLSTQANNGVRFLAVATTPIACFMILMPEAILTVLYSPEFTEASRLLQVLAVAGAFRIISFPISITLMAKKHLKEYFSIELSWYVIFAVVVITLLPTIGIEATGLAVLIAYIIHGALFVIFVKKNLGVVYGRKNWTILATSAALLISALATNEQYPMLSYAIVAVSLPAWLYYATEKEEKSQLASRALRLLRRQ